MTASGTSPATSRPPSGRGVLRAIDHYALPVFTTLAIGYLLVPIFVMVVFSFNQPVGKFNYSWNHFSLEGWLHPFDWPGLPDSVRISLTIAFVSTIFATLLGTLIGLALTRYQFRGRGFLNGFIFLPMATPEIVLGSSLLTLFVATALPPLAGGVPTLYPTGFVTILIAHVMFNISYVVVTVKARLAGFDRRLEEAAMDLGANEWTTFWRVTFPLILPGIMAAALLAFSLSIDDFIITNFVSGTTNTFPIWVYGVQKNALPVQINVIGSIIFFVAVGFVAVSTIVSARRSR
ncbi:MAG: spermidine/putrescine transport system permease protein [Chloroflexota bacterium]|jgi:spermidine/putrescine transport system permease protein|nr:spermidine/putrescine transport system permease protein [Chloroflexota bacterium]